MIKMFTGIFMLVFLAVVSSPAHAESEKADAAGILTAIDVTDLMSSGSSDADIAKKMSGQRGFDREAALKKGNSDQGIIKFLLTEGIKDTPDKNKLVRHKFNGDKFYKEAEFAKAATEYTLAIRYSKDSYALYKARGDSYRKYLIGKIPVPAKDSTGTKPAFPDKPEMFLCGSIYSDYTKAMDVNKSEMRINESRLNILKSSMEKKDFPNFINVEVVPDRSTAAGNIHGMRELDRLYRAQRIRKSNDTKIRKDISDLKQICGDEDGSGEKTLKPEKSGNMNKK